MKSDKNYVYTERAHYMCPNMHFGIMAKIECNYDERLLRQSIDTVSYTHLDVYKRQQRNTAAGKARTCPMGIYGGWWMKKERGMQQWAMGGMSFMSMRKRKWL